MQIVFGLLQNANNESINQTLGFPRFAIGWFMLYPCFSEVKYNAALF